MWLFDELFLAIKVILRWIIKILNNSVSVAWDNQRQNNHQLLQLSRRNPLSLSLTLTLSMFQFLSISNHVNHKIQQVLQSNLDLQRFNEGQTFHWHIGVKDFLSSYLHHGGVPAGRETKTEMILRTCVLGTRGWIWEQFCAVRGGENVNSSLQATLAQCLQRYNWFLNFAGRHKLVSGEDDNAKPVAGPLVHPLQWSYIFKFY